MSNMLRGKLCFKGDKGDTGAKGDNAYPIEILSGSITEVSSGSSATTKLSYPTGFARTNAIVISALTSVDATSSYETDANTKVNLGFSDITVTVKNSGSGTKDIYFKVAIMKVG